MQGITAQLTGLWLRRWALRRRGDGMSSVVDRGAATVGDALLARVEQIKRFAIITDEWLPDSDELTPTMKLKRRPIAQKYASQIEALYTTKDTE
jgi:long-subunit acyl-CoA synthetase (AMP-forming)